MRPCLVQALPPPRKNRVLQVLDYGNTTWKPKAHGLELLVGSWFGAASFATSGYSGLLFGLLGFPGRMPGP